MGEEWWDGDEGAHAWNRREELTPGEGRRRKTRGNSECRGHVGATMMPAFKTLSRISSSAKTSPYFVKMLVFSLHLFT